MSFWQDYHQKRRTSDMYDPLGFGGGIHVSRKSRGGEDSDSNWIFTYSDMITLLLAFFIILSSVSVPSQEKFNKVQESIAKTLGVKHVPVQLPRNIKVIREEAPSVALAPPVPSPDGKASPEAATAAEKAAAPELPKEMVTMTVILTALKGVIEDQGLAQQVSVSSDKNAATITFPEGVFFDSGEAAFSRSARPFLKKVAVALKGIQTPFMVEVEGHTDSRPIISNRRQFPTNWELSTARSTQVVRYFLQEGLSPRQLVAKGFADTRPIDMKDQKKNRRVVLRIIAADDIGSPQIQTEEKTHE